MHNIITVFMSKASSPLYSTHLHTDEFSIWVLCKTGGGNTAATATPFLLLQRISLKNISFDCYLTYRETSKEKQRGQVSLKHCICEQSKWWKDSLCFMSSREVLPSNHESIFDKKGVLKLSISYGGRSKTLMVKMENVDVLTNPGARWTAGLFAR